MKLKFLGGAREIGASCCLLEIAGKCLLIDAGIRLAIKPGMSPLPRLSLIKKVDIILVTHAHLDHSGSLPIVHKMFPEAQFICTEGTFELFKILLLNNLKIMSEEVGDNAAPLYTRTAYESLLNMVYLTEYGHWFQPFLDADISICFEPAGHIMSASSICIEAEGKRIMFSGDFCIADQRTVRGFRVFNWQPDVLIMEATYGDEVHPSRKQEEFELARAILSVVKNKGIVLMPSFAVGRAQEVIQILLEFQRNKTLPSFPIFYDGLVAPVCSLYQDFGLMPQLSFSNIMEVGKEVRKAEIARKRPAVIIASSGSLKGGASLEYARQVVENPRDAIFFSGYQDEESPGRILLDLEQRSGVNLGGEIYKVQCQVARYNFSAHADLAQLRHYVFELNPQVVVLNHSPFLIMRKFARSIKNGRVVWTPSNRCLFDPFETTNLRMYVNRREAVVSRKRRGISDGR